MEVWIHSFFILALYGRVWSVSRPAALLPGKGRSSEPLCTPQEVEPPTIHVVYLLRWHIYLLTPWCRVLLEKLTGLQLVKKFPTFHGTRWFITALTSVRHLSLSWASPTQSIYPHSTSWRSILILSTHLRLGLPMVSFPPVSPPRPYTPPSPQLAHIQYIIKL